MAVNDAFVTTSARGFDSITFGSSPSTFLFSKYDNGDVQSFRGRFCLTWHALDVFFLLVTLSLAADIFGQRTNGGRFD